MRSKYLSPFSGGEGRSVTGLIDRNVMRAIWTADSKSMVVSANDGTGVSVWMQPVDGPAKRFDLGKAVATGGVLADASLAPDGTLAFTASTLTRPGEIYVFCSAAGKPGTAC